MASFLYETTQSATDSAPTASTDGQGIASFNSVTVLVDAGVGETITSLVMQCYVYEPELDGWFRLTDMDLTYAGSSQRRVAFPAVNVVGPRAMKLKWVSTGSIFTGATVTVYQAGYVARRSYAVGGRG